MTSTARKTTEEMLSEQLASTKELLGEIWDAIDGIECPVCDGSGKVGAEEVGLETDTCRECDGLGTTFSYEGQPAQEYLDEMPLEVVWAKGEPFAVVLGTGGPHVEITGGGMASGTAYNLDGYWGGAVAHDSGSAITRTGKYFRELVEEQDDY